MPGEGVKEGETAKSRPGFEMQFRGQDLGGALRGWGLLTSPPAETPPPAPPCPAGGGREAAVSWELPQEPPEPVPSFPQSCPANMAWGQLLLALIVPSASCCHQVFDNKTSPTTQGRVKVRRLPESQPANSPASECSPSILCLHPLLPTPRAVHGPGRAVSMLPESSVLKGRSPFLAYPVISLTV